ncbi:N-acetyltransferase [Streptomyces olivaceoviridis]|uniref:N-acetyltransferase n=1 Tax=Streptomyces olivaceoviridis TaxID=1921 RepID=UPI0036B7CB9B
MGHAFASRGLGGVLARAALARAREEHLGVLPYCPVIRGWILSTPRRWTWCRRRSAAFGL